MARQQIETQRLGNKFFILSNMFSIHVSYEKLAIEACMELLSQDDEKHFFKEINTASSDVNDAVEELKEWLMRNRIKAENPVFIYIIQYTVFNFLKNAENEMDKPAALTTAWIDQKRALLSSNFHNLQLLQPAYINPLEKIMLAINSRDDFNKTWRNMWLTISFLQCVNIVLEPPLQSTVFPSLESIGCVLSTLLIFRALHIMKYGPYSPRSTIGREYMKDPSDAHQTANPPVSFSRRDNILDSSDNSHAADPQEGLYRLV